MLRISRLHAVEILDSRARWPSGAGPGGFRRLGRAGGCWADVPEVPADAGGGEPVGPAPVGCQGPGKPQLGVGGDDQPGPSVGCLAMGRVPSAAAQEERWVSLGCSRSQERTRAAP